MLLSVIVPVYEAGELLAPCVRSILALPWDLELILVDDGSTDGALAHVNLSDDRVRLLRRSHAGVSEARNAGMALARGEWLWFVDADDEILWEGGLPAAVESIPEQTRLLVLPCLWEESGQKEMQIPVAGEIPYNVWRCWFRRKEVERQSLRFVAGRRYGEDQEFILHFLLSSGTISVPLQAPCYHYTKRPSGAVSQRNNRGRQRLDVSRVAFRFTVAAVCHGAILNTWVINQIKRLFKTFLTI